MLISSGDMGDRIINSGSSDNSSVSQPDATTVTVKSIDYLNKTVNTLVDGLGTDTVSSEQDTPLTGRQFNDAMEKYLSADSLSRAIASAIKTLNPTTNESVGVGEEKSQAERDVEAKELNVRNRQADQTLADMDKNKQDAETQKIYDLEKTVVNGLDNIFNNPSQFFNNLNNWIMKRIAKKISKFRLGKKSSSGGYTLEDEEESPNDNEDESSNVEEDNTEPVNNPVESDISGSNTYESVSTASTVSPVENTVLETSPVGGTNNIVNPSVIAMGGPEERVSGTEVATSGTRDIVPEYVQSLSRIEDLLSSVNDNIQLDTTNNTPALGGPQEVQPVEVSPVVGEAAGPAGYLSGPMLNSPVQNNGYIVDNTSSNNYSPDYSTGNVGGFNYEIADVNEVAPVNTSIVASGPVNRDAVDTGTPVVGEEEEPAGYGISSTGIAGMAAPQTTNEENLQKEFLESSIAVDKEQQEVFTDPDNSAFGNFFQDEFEDTRKQQTEGNGSSASGAFTALFDAAKWVAISAAIISVSVLLKQFLTDYAPQIRDALNNINAVGSSVVGIIQALQPDIIELGHAVINNIVPVVQSVGTTVTGFINTVGPVITTTVKDGIQALHDFIEPIKQTAITVINGLGSVIQDVIDIAHTFKTGGVTGFAKALLFGVASTTPSQVSGSGVASVSNSSRVSNANRGNTTNNYYSSTANNTYADLNPFSDFNPLGV